jgi:hypothetical protein
MSEWYWDCIRILHTSAGVTMRMASVRPERRPAVKVTVGEGVDAVNPVYESYHLPRISRYLNLRM